MKRNELKIYQCAVGPENEAIKENCVTLLLQIVQRCNAVNHTMPWALQKVRKINKEDTDTEVDYITAVYNSPVAPPDEQCKISHPR